MADIYYGRYITADILRQIYQGKYATADTLRQMHCVQQKRLYFDKCTAPDAFDCCIRILSLQGIDPKTPLDRFMLYTSRTQPFLDGHNAEPRETQGFREGWMPMGEQSLPNEPQGQTPLYILDILYIALYIYILYIYMYIYIYILGSRALRTRTGLQNYITVDI